jgi:hypothetical protein
MSDPDTEFIRFCGAPGARIPAVVVGATVARVVVGDGAVVVDGAVVARVVVGAVVVDGAVVARVVVGAEVVVGAVVARVVVGAEVVVGAVVARVVVVVVGGVIPAAAMHPDCWLLGSRLHIANAASLPLPDTTAVCGVVLLVTRVVARVVVGAVVTRVVVGAVVVGAMVVFVFSGFGCAYTGPAFPRGIVIRVRVGFGIEVDPAFTGLLDVQEIGP